MNLLFTVLLSLGFTFAVPSTRDAASSTFNATSTEKSASPSPSPSPSPSDIQALIQAMAEKHRVPADFVKSIVAAESNFNSDALSPKGAIGLMQLMPDTAREWGGDPKIPEQNIEAGTRYLSFLINHYRKSRKPLTCAIAAYNAGPAVVDRYHGVPPFRETRGYVARVLSLLHRFQRQGRRGAGGTLVADAMGDSSAPEN
jgi:soluble lytic murein transglycosylase-like protein